MNRYCHQLTAAFVFGAISLLSASSGMAADWPQWHGPNRNSISPETINWPTSGPKQLWKAAVGEGYSCVSISKGRAYTIGNANGQDTVWCFDAKTGVVIWKYSYPCVVTTSYKEFPGTRATPTVDGNFVYTVGRNGDLLALDAMKGTVIWSANYVKDFGARIPRWGFAGSPLVEGKLLIVIAGGTNGSVVAFDKTTGKVIWKTGSDIASYCSPVAFTLGTQRIVTVSTTTTDRSNILYAYNLADGKELWNTNTKFPKGGDYAADPVPLGDKLFLPYAYGCGYLCKINGSGLEEVYKTKSTNGSAGTGNAVLIGDFLYEYFGPWNTPAMICLDPNTGTIKWKHEKAGGAFLAAGKNLLFQSVTGSLVMAEATPDGYKELGSAPVLTGQCWTAPSLANGLVYCRNTAGDVVCLDLNGK